MNTVLAIALISLYILMPLVTALAATKGNEPCTVAGVIATVCSSVSFWVVFGPYTEDTMVFGLAGIWQVIGGAICLCTAANELDII